MNRAAQEQPITTVPADEAATGTAATVVPGAGPTVSPATVPPLTQRQLAPIKKRYSITSMLTLTSSWVLLLFISMAALMQNRLQDMQHSLANIAGGAVPAVIESGKVYSQINQLLYLTEALGQARSQALRHNLYQDIQQNLVHLTTLTQEKDKTLYQSAQLVALKEELQSLNELTSTRLDLQTQLAGTQQQIYQLYDQVQDVVHTEFAGQNLQSAWLLQLAEIVAQSGKAMTTDRLLPMRQLQQQVRGQLAQQQQALRQVPAAYQLQAKQVQQQLEQLLLAEDGLFVLRLQQLVVSGRATGRSNFVRNLVLDYARLAENSAYTVNAAVLAETEQSNRQFRHYSQQILIGSVLVILLLAAGIYLVHLRVVRRLEQLNKNVLRQMQGKPAAHDVSGYDEIAAIAASFQFFVSRVKQQQHELELLSYTDSLTGVANRRALQQKLQEHLSQAQRQQWPLSLLMIDVDCFKAYNDHYGHQAGDLVLQQIAGLLQQGLNRAADVLARFGGEEFVIILPDTGKEGAIAIARQLQLIMTQAAIVHQHNSAAPYITISIGIASLSQATPADYDVMLRLADDALYQAKRAGRNCII